MLRISSTTNLHSDYTTNVSEYIRDEIAFQKKTGFDAIDFSVQYLLRGHGDDYEEIVLRALDDAKELGMKFEICHLPYGVKVGGSEAEVAPFNNHMHKMIDAAALLGVGYAVLHPNTVTVPAIKFNKTKEYDSVMNHIAPFVEHANRVGVNIVVENMRPVPERYMVHRYCQDPDELCDIADKLGIGICWDFGHAHITGLVQSDAIGYVGNRLKVLHINDNLSDDDVHLPPFVGSIDWRDAMSGLKNIGFSGLFNYEIATSRIPCEMRESFARYLVDAAKELNSYIGE